MFLCVCLEKWNSQAGGVDYILCGGGVLEGDACSAEGYISNSRVECGTIPNGYVHRLSDMD